MRGARYALLAVALAGCSRNTVTTTPEPASRSEWTATLVQAAQDASAGRYVVADRVLADFSTRNPASPDAAEAIYWRALYRLDPANQGASPRDAAAMLDSYLSVSGAPHRAEALTLRRIAMALESRSAASSTAAPAPKTDAPTDKAKDDEIQRLKDELAKSNAELERIKRRLAKP